MYSKALDFFGNKLMEDVRDRTINIWNKLLDGEMKGETAKKVECIIKNLSNEDIKLVKNLIPLIVNEDLFNMLNMFENNNELEMHVNLNGESVDITDESDGLAGELFTEDGWIEKFSNYKN